MSSDNQIEGNKEVSKPMQLDQSTSEENMENKEINEDKDTDKSSLLDKILPSFNPGFDVKEKLIDNEVINDKALIRHYNEIQIILGLVSFALGFVLVSFYNSGYLYFLSILGILLVVTGYEIEYIVVTNKRLLLRKIGLIERFVRIPSDEEHVLAHVVSYSVGRAPPNWVLTGFGLLGSTVIFTELQDLAKLLVLLASAFILSLGLRLGRRVITLNLAGSHSILLGLRKGVPVHILGSISESIYNDQGKSGHISDHSVPLGSSKDGTKEDDEKPAK